MARSVRIGLIGAGIQKSLSPSLHMEEGKAQGLDYTYELLDLDVLGVGADALPQLIVQAEADGFAGLNITYPCKQMVVPLLHALSPDARALNAVNTVVFRDGKRHGHNTDVTGFAESFRRNLSDAPKARAVQMGAGGAGGAVAHALLAGGVGTLTIFDLDRAKVEALAESLVARFGPGRAIVGTDLAAALSCADGLVNTTPMGMQKSPGMAVPRPLLRSTLWVAEIVYFPLETSLLRAARELGCRTVSGGDMAVFQAVEAFRLFTGIVPDAERMVRHFAALTRN